jgi:glutathione synthase
MSALLFVKYRTLLKQYREVLGLDSERVPRNYAATQFAEALGKAWAEYNNDRSTLCHFPYAVYVYFIKII